MSGIPTTLFGADRVVAVWTSPKPRRLARVVVVDEVGGAVVADREFLDRVTLGVLARGHVLLEDVPGTGRLSRRDRSRPRSA